MIKGSLHQEDIIITNSYVLSNRSSKYMKQKFTELMGEIDTSTIIVRDFNISLSIINRTNR